MPPPFCFCLLCLFNFENFTTVVSTAVLTSSVRQMHFTALGTSDETGCFQSKVGTTSLISSCAGNLILWDRHS